MLTELKLWSEWNSVQKNSNYFDSGRRVDFYNKYSSRIREHNSKTINPDVVIAVPAFNEQENIPKALASINESLALVSNFSVKTVIVDNCSNDATGEVSTAFGADVIKENKKGLGNARQSGLDYANNNNSKILVYSDADSIVPRRFIDGHVSSLLNENKVYSRGSLLFVPDDINISSVGRLFRTLFYSSIANSAHCLLNKLHVWTAIGSGAFLVHEAIRIGGYVRSKMRGADSTLMHNILSQNPHGLVENYGICVINSSRRLDAEGILKHGLWRIKNDIRSILDRRPDTDTVYADYR